MKLSCFSSRFRSFIQLINIKKEEAARSYIATEDILTDAEAQKHAQEAEQMQMRVIEQQDLEPKKQVPPQCSSCNVIDHTELNVFRK